MPGSSEDLKSQPLSLPTEVSGFCAARLCCPTGTCVLSNRSCIRCALDTSGGPLQSLKSGRGGGMHSRTRSSRAQSHPRSVIVACFCYVVLLVAHVSGYHRRRTLASLCCRAPSWMRNLWTGVTSTELRPCIHFGFVHPVARAR